MRFRYLLPVVNLVIDAALLIAAVHVVDADRLARRNPYPLWHQSYERIDPNWWRNDCWYRPQAPVQAITSGTLPATLTVAAIFEAFIPNGATGWRLSTPVDFRWAGLHFLCAALCWYTIGRWLESRGSIWKKIVAIYVVARVLTIPASMMLEYDSWWMLCYMLLILAWTIFAMALVVTVLLRLWRRFSSAKVEAR